MAITRCLLHRQSLSLALFLLLLVLFLSVSTAKKQEESVKDDVDLTDSALIEWIRASGGHSDVRVGVVAGAPDGAEPTLTKKETKSTKKKRRRRKRSKKESSSSALRGTIATRDIAAGEAFIRLPSNLSVPLGGTGVTSPVREGEEEEEKSERSLFFSLSLSRGARCLLQRVRLSSQRFENSTQIK